MIGAWLDLGAAPARNVGHAAVDQPSISLPNPPAAASAKAQQVEAFGRLPLAFEANQGQSDRQVRFLARGGGYGVFLTPTEAVLTLRRDTARAFRREDLRPGGRPAPSAPPAVLRMRLAGAAANPRITGMEPLPGRVNYFIGNDSTRWLTDIPTYARVRYEGVYPGVNMVFYGNDGRLEYDLVVAPGADPRAIAIELAGADAVRLGPRGDLEVEVAGSRLVMRRPVIYQEIGRARRPVRGGFIVDAARRVRFEVGEYDRRLPLVIDPVLVYALRLNGLSVDYGLGVAADAAGNAYVTGSTQSSDFPGTNPSQFGPTQYRCYVIKLNPAGTAVLYTTFLGAADYATGWAIAVDASGSAYVAGTAGSNFPTTAGTQTTVGRAFVTRLNAAGNTLVYSTRLGGTINDAVYGIAVSGGYAHVTGTTSSSDFHMGALAGWHPLWGGGTSDAFVARLTPTGGIVFATFLGGAGNDWGAGIALDAKGNVYVTGRTSSTDFPTRNPLQATLGDPWNSDAFVTVLTTTGMPVYSTYLGGSGSDAGTSIAVDGARNAYVSGSTSSANFPTMMAQQVNLGSTTQAFVTKINPFGAAMAYSTFLGGTNYVDHFNVAVDAAGNAYVVGDAGPGLPSKSPVQPAFGGVWDAYVAQLNVAGAVTFSSYVGGSNSDVGAAVALDGVGSVYVVGGSTSPNIPGLNPNSGSQDAFVAKISIPPPPPLPCADPPNTSMLAWYPFDEAAGVTTTANLASGNTGTRFGGPVVIPGKVGNALRFDGVNDYVESPSSFLTNIGPAGLPQSCTGGWSTCRGDFSVDAWVRLQPSSVSLNLPILDKRGGGMGAGSYLFWIYQGRISLQLGTGFSGSATNYTSASVPALFDNQWHLVGVTISRRQGPDGIRWYFDGSLVSTSNPTSPARYGSLVNHGPLRIGRVSTTLSTAWFKGDLDEVEFFSRVLTPEEMQGIFNAGSAGKCKDPLAIGQSSDGVKIVVP